jgi:ribosomal protein S18 acetylase RimI-like enzyme
VGRALVSAAEQYLRDGGAEVIYAGGMRPLNPFYLGLYGGAELPGFLESDGDASPFLQACGYREADRALVFHRDSRIRTGLFDMRFSRLRRMVDLEIDAGAAQPTWWWSSVMGLFDQLRVRLVSRESGRAIAEASCWEMVGFSRTWGRRTVGLVNVHVEESMRRRGIGKLLLSELLARLRDEGIELVEVQTMQRNQAAVGLYRSLGFEQVDEGVIYRRS